MKKRNMMKKFFAVTAAMLNEPGIGPMVDDECHRASPPTDRHRPQTGVRDAASSPS